MDLTGKTICFLGDSITCGGGASSHDKCFIELLKAEYPQTRMLNYGAGGTRIARQKKSSRNIDYDKDFLSRVCTMEKGADYVIVFGGTNDYGSGDAEMGVLGNKDPYTFMGAMQVLTEYLVNVYGKDKVCYILPIPRLNEDDPHGSVQKETACYPLNAYREAQKSVLNHYGVDFIDLSNVFPMPTSDNGDAVTVDGLHPNDRGHRIIADAIKSYFQKI